jgi:pimeloyl-ACP methyl ester carboxylesterase
MNAQWHRKRRALKMALLNLGPPAPLSVRPIRQSTPTGISFDLYEPKGKAESTHILLYGMDFAGEQDRRLIRFACSYAASGIRAVVPVLPGLKSFLVDAADLETLCALTEFLHEWLNSPVRFTGFSIGAGYGLVAAARADLAEMVDLLLLFGAPYSLADLWQTVADLQQPDRADKRSWDSFVMGKTAVAYHQIDDLGLNEPERAEFLDLMQHYCERKEVASEFYDQVLSHRAIADFSLLMPDKVTMERLSPAGKLQGVKAKVLLLHGAKDPTSPPENPRRIMAELPRYEGARGHRMLITPLFDHVTPNVAFRMGDANSALDILGELFA